MSKKEQFEAAEAKLEGLLSYLFSEEWADLNDPRVKDCLKKLNAARMEWMRTNTHEART